ncbi:MAG: porin, partial [Woeseiaceae bacterium]
SKYGSSSFVDNIVQVAMKAGSAKVKIQFGPAENANDNNGHIALAVTGKASGVRYWASYNNGTADGDSNPALTTSKTNLKIGGSMKFGKIKASLNYTSMDNDGAAVAGNATDSISLGANMGFGNGLSGDITYATRSGDVSADDATFIRVAVMKKLNKGTSIYGGITTTDVDAANSDTSEMGVGMVVKF